MKGTVGIDVFITSRNVKPLLNVIRISTPALHVITEFILRST